MAKINQDFPHDIFRMIHKPIRDEDKKNFNFLERFLLGPQAVWEEKIDPKIRTLIELIDPAKTPQPRFLKDHVGFTKELDNITRDISDDDLRKVIALAVALWKTKGLELGYENIIRLFTGANVRIFNWFDFRMIVGEKAFGEEQLGEDAWFISDPGVKATGQTILDDPINFDEVNTVAGLWNFELNFKDKSRFRNDGIPVGDIELYKNGPISNNYLHIENGYVRIPHTAKYDFSDDFTIEGFISGDLDSDASDGYIWSKIKGSKEISIQYLSSTNDIVVRLHDGTTLETWTLATGVDLDDGNFRHWRLVVKRDTNTARLYFNGNIVSPEIDISSLGDLTNAGEIFIGSSGFASGYLKKANIDDVRLSFNAVNDTADVSILVPAQPFVEFHEEQLDEFFSDIRVVDDGSGTLNKTLLKRILNLMRPTSERLNLVFVRFAEDFSIGKGKFTTISGSSTINQDGLLVMDENAFEIVDVLNADDFKNIVYQVKLKLTDLNMQGGLVFNWQDVDNYYYYKAKTGTQEFELVKVVAGIETILAGPVVNPELHENTDYILTIITSEKQDGNIEIRCKHDGNIIFKIEDGTFTDGRFGLKTEASTQMLIDEIEMYEQPLETDFVLPGFEG